MAEAICCHLLALRGWQDWQVDSCGTGPWHIGKSPDPRSCAVLDQHGVAWSHRARQLRASDFTHFDHLLAMDEDNLAELRQQAPPACHARIALLGDHDPHQIAEVPDPYYGGPDGFERVYRQLSRSIDAFLNAQGSSAD